MKNIALPLVLFISLIALPINADVGSKSPQKIIIADWSKLITQFNGGHRINTVKPTKYIARLKSLSAKPPASSTITAGDTGPIISYRSLLGQFPGAQ